MWLLRIYDSLRIVNINYLFLLSYINGLGYFNLKKLRFYFDFINSISLDLELIQPQGLLHCNSPYLLNCSHLRFKPVLSLNVGWVGNQWKNRTYPLFFAFNRYIRASVYERTYQNLRLDSLKNNFFSL